MIIPEKEIWRVELKTRVSSESTVTVLVSGEPSREGMEKLIRVLEIVKEIFPAQQTTENQEDK